MNYGTEGFHTYHVYIITNKNKTVLYIGVTNNLARRLFEHSKNARLNKKSFAAKYNCEYLLYFEKFTSIQVAIRRKKEMKGWSRDKKLALFKSINENIEFLNYVFPYT